MRSSGQRYIITETPGSPSGARVSGLASHLRCLTVAVVIAVLASASPLVTPQPVGAATCRSGVPTPVHAEQIELSPSYGAIWRLYQAFFLRQPDDGGMAYWMDRYRTGTSLKVISDNFVASDEFVGRYGRLDDRGFVDLVYTNVMCRDPDAGGYDYWTGRLANEAGFDRGQLMLFFSDSPEYRERTNTQPRALRPLAQATMAADGYASWTITGGQVVELDYSRVDFSAGEQRCSVASINGNWFYTPERANPRPVGFAVIDGRIIDNGTDNSSRGIFGERWTTTSESVTFDAFNPGETGPTYHLSSSLEQKGSRALESYGRYRPTNLISPIENPADWRWAAAGIPMIINGQRVRDVFDPAARTNEWSYTYNTTRHSFVAFDKDSGTLMFGSTTAMTAFQVAAFVEGEGYDDLIKFDGGGSVEFNAGGMAQVAGTPRDVPLWLGIGC